MFALKNKKTGKFLALNISGNGDADNCGSYTASLEESNNFDSIIWVTSSKQDAEKVAKENVKWYNSGLEHPMNNRDFEIEVVELTTK